MTKNYLKIALILAILVVAAAGISNYLYFNKANPHESQAALIVPTTIPEPDDVVVYFAPMLTNVNPGQTFQVNIYARPQPPLNGDTSTPYNIQGADLKIQFDPKAVEVVQIQAAGEADETGQPLESGNILSLTNGISDYGNLLANPPVNGTLLGPGTAGGTLIFNVESRTEIGQNISYTNGTLLGRVTFRLRPSITPPASMNTRVTTLPGGTISRVVDVSLESHNATIAQAEINPPVNSVTPTSAQQDTQPPTVSIRNPVDKARVNRKENINIVADATDESGVSKVEFYINNRLECTDTTTSYGCFWSVAAKPNSTYTIRAVAYDSYNNQASHTVTVTSK